MELQTQLEMEKHYQKTVLFWAGISGILVAVGYIIILICFTISGFPLPHDSTTWINYLDGKIELWSGIIWLSAVTDILYIIIAYGFLIFFEKKYKFWIVLASIFFVLFAILELAGTWSIYPTIIKLYEDYKLSNISEKRMLYLAAIEYGSAHFQTSMNGFYSIVLPSLATIIYNVVMFRSKDFSKTISMIGLIAGICNIVSVFGGLIYDPLKQLVMPGSFLSLFWFLGIGIKFIKASKNQLYN
ncbi:MAG: DUF4386 family protein [Bacteroidia bacterium]